MNSKYVRAALGTAMLMTSLNVAGFASGRASTGGTVQPYTDPANLTKLPWGSRSHWIQPWRAYMDTWPSSKIENAVGINYRINKDLDSVEPIFKHLAQNGFKFVRLEFGWGTISYDDPTKFVNPDRVEKLLSACKRAGLRPLILLNSNQGIPCPSKQYTVKLTQAAAKGVTEVHIDPATLKDAVPNRSGLSNLSGNWGAQNIFTQIQPDGTCTLSKPLEKDLPAGNVPAMTLKYLPFYPSKDKSTGNEPSEFRETMDGWLSYVKTVADTAKRILGTENSSNAGFDFEVWNEMSFGSNFLDINRYYPTDKPIAKGESSTIGIIKDTVDFVRDPKNHMPAVGVTDGFESQRPWGSGTTLPAGLTAISKHPYRGALKFPSDKNPLAGRPIDALGEPAGQVVNGKWQDNFTPTYTAFLPEYFIQGIQSETLIRDLAPFENNVGNAKHGRETHSRYSNGNDAPPPGMWITEVNLDSHGADPGISPEYLQSGKPVTDTVVTPADAEHLKAKSALRYLCSYVNKGVSRIYFFEAVEDDTMGLGLMSRTFVPTVKANNNVLPSDESSITSPAISAIHRLLTAMKGDGSVSKARQISLTRVTEHEDRIQFAGNPSTANSSSNPYPPLYNRDVLAFFPFQATKNKFVIPIYIMTRNVLEKYKGDAPNSDITRFDMPLETFRLNIGNVVGTNAKVSLYDPLTGQEDKAHILRTGAKNIEMEVELTDSPRILVIEEE